MMALTVAPDVQAIVRPAWRLFDPVVVVGRDDRQNDPMALAARAMRTAVESAEVISAVRTMYKRVGIDPTKTRPSSEALLRRIRKGDELPRINSLVDIVNWTSLESQLPFGLYDADRIRGAPMLRIGRSGEHYAGIRKDDVHVAGRLVLADDEGAFGNPTSDSARTMVTPATVRAMVVIFAPVPVSASIVDRAMATTAERVARYCGDTR